MNHYTTDNELKSLNFNVYSKIQVTSWHEQLTLFMGHEIKEGKLIQKACFFKHLPPTFLNENYEVKKNNVKTITKTLELILPQSNYCLF